MKTLIAALALTIATAGFASASDTAFDKYGLSAPSGSSNSSAPLIDPTPTQSISDVSSGTDGIQMRGKPGAVDVIQYYTRDADGKFLLLWER